MEDKESIKSEIIYASRERARWSVAILLDTSFLIIWLTLQWIIDAFINYITSAGFGGVALDATQLNLFQVIFAISTLAPIAFFTLKTITIQLLRTVNAITFEVRQLRSGRMLAGNEPAELENRMILPDDDKSDEL